MKTHDFRQIAIALAGVCVACSWPQAVQAERYHIHINAHATPQPLVGASGFGGSAPFTGIYDTVNIAVDFNIDSSSQIQFGDQYCNGLVGIGCVADGYIANDLVVRISSQIVNDWHAGYTTGIYYGPRLRTFGRTYFISNGNSTSSGFSFSLLSNEYPAASMTFGHIYVSLGGVAFIPEEFAATDAFGNHAFGGAGETITLYQPVPEPDIYKLLFVGLIFTLATGFTKRSQFMSLGKR